MTAQMATESPTSHGSVENVRDCFEAIMHAMIAQNLHQGRTVTLNCFESFFSFPGSAWERTAPEALPRFAIQAKDERYTISAGRACMAVCSKAEPWNQCVALTEQYQ